MPGFKFLWTLFIHNPPCIFAGDGKHNDMVKDSIVRYAKRLEFCVFLVCCCCPFSLFGFRRTVFIPTR